jgi:hypothetical protein
MSDKLFDDLPNQFNRQAFEAWLSAKPPALVVCIAARMALMSLPKMMRPSTPIGPYEFAGLTRSIWTCVLCARHEHLIASPFAKLHWLADVFDKFWNKGIASALEAACTDSDEERIRATFNAIRETYVDTGANHLDAIKNALREADAAISNGLGGLWYMSRPVFPEREFPGYLNLRWRGIKEQLPDNEHWDVWTDWVEALVRGALDWPDAVNFELLKWREQWDRPPTEVNADVKRLLEREEWYTDKILPGVLPPKAKASNNEDIETSLDMFDFFLSYSNVDLQAAKWIDDILRRAGYRVFFQPRDMPPGSNFVIEMNRGLERSARLIALLSPDYETSKHCQAEWASAYAEDGDGAAKKLIPILLRGCVSKPLSKQIVYVSLAGLSQADQVAAILRAVGYQGPEIKVSGLAPGLAGVAALKERIDTGYAVALSPDQKLTRSPAMLADTSSLGSTPEELIQYIRQIAQRLVTDSAALTKTKSNAGVPPELEARIAELQGHFERANAALEPLALQDRVRAAHRQLANSLKSGDLPNGGNWRDHRNDLREALDLLPQIFPGLAKHKSFRARKAFERMEPDERAALKEWGKIVESSPEAAAVMDSDLKEDVADAVKRAETSNEIVQTDKSDEAIEIASETNREMASKSLIVSDWLSTPREMLKRAGKTAAEIEKTVEPFDKLYERAKGPLGKLIEYFMQWL